MRSVLLRTQDRCKAINRSVFNISFYHHDSVCGSMSHSLEPSKPELQKAPFPPRLFHISGWSARLYS